MKKIGDQPRRERDLPVRVGKNDVELGGVKKGPTEVRCISGPGAAFYKLPVRATLLKYQYSGRFSEKSIPRLSTVAGDNRVHIFRDPFGPFEMTEL